MKKYESYIDSGVDWIGQIPSEWQISKMKYYANVFTGNSLNDSQKLEFESDDPDHLAYIASKDIDVNTTAVNYENGTRIPRDQVNLKVAPAFSSLLCIEGGSAGRKMAFINQEVCFVNKLACIDLEKKWLAKYTFYFLKSEIFQKQFTESLAGLIGGVSITNLRNFLMPIPPNFDALEIARYLDHQTALIDELIEKKQRLIQALEEKRKAVINEAVTKGLNPSVRMKDSGIDWIGEIPEHWDIKKLRYLGKCQNGVSAGSEYFGEGDPFISYSDVYKNASLPDQILGLAKSSELDKENYSVLEGDIFFTRTSETVEEIGLSSVCLNSVPAAVFAGFLIRFRPQNPFQELNKWFSKFYFRSHIVRHHLVKEMNLVTRASLSQELLKSVPVLLPPINEQIKIGEHLQEITSSIDTTIDKIYSAIEKLKEYRQSLISEAVTGKIDVRDWEPSN
ncbi:MAG: restriction endonuclease subunit S [Lunatimonas sp.]|uniref:restriction endonuclease subunit S n=1 Tax=Lunatimonas sp. TaxID=2060141 RepID=UPI00263BCA53|nr:restriction endonuclease subunit S [Lunatimonas sp.]MCC5938642.1 restriction endonuclease subunit S [Lunatimonas sp.]